MAKLPAKKNQSTMQSETSPGSAPLPAPTGDPWKGKAVTKANGIFHRFLDRLEPEHIAARERAKAESRVVKAQSKAQARLITEAGKLAVRSLKERTEARVHSSNIRQQANIEAVMEEAYAAFPPSDESVSDEPVSEDFIHRLFDDCKDIGDEEMQTLWGRILAGEIVRPGSFHPKTLGVVRDLTKDDATRFVSLCRFGFVIGKFTPIIFDVEGEIYNDFGINFQSINHLENLGLIDFQNLTGFSRTQLPQKFSISYARKIFVVTLPDGTSQMNIGKVLLTEAGRQLAPLSNAEIISGFPEYAIAKWTESGIVVMPA